MSQRSPREAPPRPGRARLVRATAALAVALGAFARSRFILPYGLRNGEMTISEFRLLEDPSDHPRLAELRRREKLEEVVAPGKTEFEKIVLLRRWAHRQWESAATFYYPPWDALEILDLARQRKNYGFCAQYAIVFLQACRSLGLHARYVDVGHFLTAVWSDDHNRWIVMDPTNDLHFELNGRPLSGRELSELAWSGRTNGLEAVKGDGERQPAGPKDIEMWKKYSIMFNGDQLTHPMNVSVNGKWEPLVHQADFRRYPVLGRDYVGYSSAALAWDSHGRPHPWGGSRRDSDDPDNFNNGYNQTIIFLAGVNPAKGIAKVRLLNDDAPDFKVYMVRINEGGWVDGQENVVLKLREGANHFHARLKTKQGWLGPESSLDLFYKRSWF